MSEPWWNDKDKVGGFMATLSIILIMLVVVWIVLLVMYKITLAIT